MACLLEPLISKVTDLVWDKAIVRIGAQFKYVCCYKSCIEDLRKAEHALENDKEFIQQSVITEAYNLRDITAKANEWLEEVRVAQEEVKSLIRTYEEGQAKMRSLKGQILNPVARYRFGRRATKNIITVKEVRGGKPALEELAAAPMPPGVVVNNGVRRPDGAQQDNIVRSTSRWIETMEKVMAALKDESINVVGLYGMGGVGKSTLINDVRLQVLEHCLFDEMAQVEVKAVPNITQIQDEIASVLGLKLENNASTVTRAEKLEERLLKIVDKQKKTKSVLIILDDLWEKLDRSKVGIPLGNDKVKIKLLLTSRDKTLLSDKMGAPEPIQFGVLSDEDAETMFKSVVGDRADVADKVSKIAKKCSGLPVIIMAIANALKDMHLDEWDNALNRLQVRDELSKLEVSYEYLPSEESKHLFLLCGIVRGPQIRVRDLLKYTFGLGLYERKDIHTLETAETELKNLLSGLEAASMLLKSDDIRYVSIHDRMRDLAVKIVDRDHSEFGHFTLRDYRCKLPRRFDATKLELLLSYCEGDSLQVQDSFFRDMKKLYVLEFTNLHGAFSLPSPTHLDLGNLETLCLHDCRLSDISMIGELKGLQILSFRGSDICKLPIQLRGLIALKMLDLSDCKKLTQIEADVLGSLTKLEELNMENSFKNWEIDQEDDAPPINARLTELKNMSHLSNVRLCIPHTSMLPKDGRLFSSKLTTYQIKLGQFSDIFSEFNVVSKTLSRALILSFDSPDILWQDWVQATLQTAEVLYLSGCLDRKCESIGEMCVEGFKCLKHLRMKKCPSFRFIISSNDDSCTNLESLTLENLEGLEKLCGGLPRHEEAFSKLRVVKVNSCSKLTHLFDFSLLRSRVSSQLEEIIVNRCKEMQCIVASEGDNKYDAITLSKLQKLEVSYLPKFSGFCAGPSSNVLFTTKKVAFPCLESLIIHGLELDDIWHPTDPPSELGNLRTLDVQSCNKLVRVINSNVLMRLQRNLESLSIWGCDLMKEVFDVDGIISSCTDQNLVLFSRLKELRLRRMKGLEGVHNNKNLMMMMAQGGRSMRIFPNIELLVLENCPHLRSVLCCSLPSAGGGFEHLKDIKIEECEEMEAVVEVTLRMVDQETQHAHSTTTGHASSIGELVLFRRLKELYLSENDSLKGIYVMHNLSGRDDDRVLTTFPDIVSLHVSDCGGLRYVLSWSLLPPRVGGFVYLRKIRIWNCKQMEAIVQVVRRSTVDQETNPAATATGDAHHHQNHDAVSYSYSSLKEIGIFHCSQFRTFCQYLCSEQDSAADDLPLFSDKEIFPCLESLSFGGLSKLVEIWPHEVPPQSSFKMLKEVQIFECRELSTVFPSALIARLENLTSIEVRSCDQMIQLIIAAEEKKSKRRHAVHGGGGTGISNSTVEEEAGMAARMEVMFSFPCLRTLILRDLRKLDRFYSSSSAPACGFQFPSLETLQIWTRSSGVKTLFSDQRRPTGLVDGVDDDLDSDTIGAFFRYCDTLAIPNLKSIELHGLGNLTKIWEGEKPESHILKLVSLELMDSCLSCTNFQSLLPPIGNVLTQLILRGCHGLQYLLTPVGATSLVHLTSLSILDCDNIKEVVTAAASNENEGGDHISDITFSHLKVLKLCGLRRLEKFSSVNNIVLNFPSLDDLFIWICPNMTTFSSGSLTTSTHKFGDLNSFVQKKLRSSAD